MLLLSNGLFTATSGSFFTASDDVDLDVEENTSWRSSLPYPAKNNNQYNVI